MPSKPRTLAGILRLRRHADRAYNLVQRDPATARVHGSARWQAVRAQVLRDEPVCRACARLGLTEPATTVDHIVGVAVGRELELRLLLRDGAQRPGADHAVAAALPPFEGPGRDAGGAFGARAKPGHGGTSVGRPECTSGVRRGIASTRAATWGYGPV
jgi:hypothetical protein